MGGWVCYDVLLKGKDGRLVQGKALRLARASPRHVASEHTNPAGWPRGIEQNPIKTALAVFDVGEANLRIRQRLNADLVTLSEAGVE